MYTILKERLNVNCIEKNIFCHYEKIYKAYQLLTIILAKKD